MSGTLPIVVVAQPYLGSLDHEIARAASRVRIVGADVDTPEQLEAATRDAAALIVTTHSIAAEHVASLGRGVKVIARAGIGLDAIDLDAARERGIAVFHTPDYCIDEVADQAVTSILMLQREMALQQQVARRAGWTGREAIRLRALATVTVGVVGAGRIGRAVLNRLEPFSVHRVAVDPVAGLLPAGVSRCETLEELLAIADVVTLHVPLTPETRHLLSEPRIRSMRRGSYVVNVSRGPLIDNAALAAALHDGHIAGAAIDVFEPEPPAADDPLLDAPNAILTPHFAWHSIDSEVRCRNQTLDAAIAIIEGREPVDGRLAVRP